MPSQDRNLYSNKESCKVNTGLDHNVGSSNEEPMEDTVQGPFSTNTPAVDINFSLLTAPTIAPAPAPSIAQLAHRLLHPPPHAFVHGILSMQWVISAVGHAHIEFRESDERYVLSADSQLRERGVELGVPVMYLEWLCGGASRDGDGESAAEQSVNLTRAFFEALRD